MHVSERAPALRTAQLDARRTRVPAASSACVVRSERVRRVDVQQRADEQQARLELHAFANFSLQTRKRELRSASLRVWVVQV